MTNDLISDMITRLRNASLSRHHIVSVIYTRTNLNILKVLKKEGYIQDFFFEKSREILVQLKYKGWWIKKPLFSIFKRISKPGQRIFSGYKNFAKHFAYLKYKQGIAIVSTSSGIMSHHKAQKLKKGGEILCYIN
jgi:small subunit ribosomal protein S8